MLKLRSSRSLLRAFHQPKMYNKYLNQYVSKLVCFLRGHVWIRLPVVFCKPPNTHKVDQECSRCGRIEVVFRDTRKQWWDKYIYIYNKEKKCQF